MSEWRPSEPCKENYEAAKNRGCNFHTDCEEADQAVKSTGGRKAKDFVLGGTRIVMTAEHCYSDDCPDCFGDG